MKQRLETTRHPSKGNIKTPMRAGAYAKEEFRGAQIPC